MSDHCTIFEQDGKVYCVLSHSMPSKDLAKYTAQEIRAMAKIPRAQMRVVTVEEFKAMPFGKPSNGETSKKAKKGGDKYGGTQGLL